MNIAIIEDEYLLADELEQKIKKLHPSYHILVKIQSVEEAVEWLTTHTCDLIFMDIQLSDGISFTIFEKIKVNTPVIFTTGYDEYAIKAFEVNSIAYLLKPVKDDDIENAFLKYEHLKQSYSGNLDKLVADFTQQTRHPYLERMTLARGPLKKTVDVSEIAFFKAEGRYVIAHIHTAGRFFCKLTLNELEKSLDPKAFIRINRTFIVHKTDVKEWYLSQDNKVKIRLMEFDQPDPAVSRSRIRPFIQWLES